MTERHVKFINITNVDFTVFFYQPSYEAPLIQEQSERTLASYEKIHCYPMFCVCIYIYIWWKNKVFI